MISIDIKIGHFHGEMKKLMSRLEGSGRLLVLKAGGMAISSMSTRAFRDESLRPIPWKPLSPRRLAEKKASGRTAILIDTGALFHSIRCAEPTGDQIEIVTDRFYAPFHQFGAGRIPARPFIPAVGGRDGGYATLIPAAQERVLRAMKAQAKAVIAIEKK